MDPPRLLLLLFSLAISSPCFAAASKWPLLTEGASHKECQQALNIAKDSFLSSSPYIYNLNIEGLEKNHSLVFMPDSGIAESALVDTLHKNGVTYFVQKKSVTKWRFVITQRNHSWRGDNYDLFMLSSGVNLDENNAYEIIYGAKKDAKKLKPILEGTIWQRAILIYNDTTKRTVAVDPQPPYYLFADWLVYAPTEDGTPEILCRVQFKPSGKDTAIKLLPKGALRQSAVLLDKILGIPSQWEGTLNPTHRLRVDAEYMWGNVLFRPWALREPSNSRDEVEIGLQRWSKGHPQYHRQYNQLRTLYPKAEEALTNHYQAQFGIDKKAAKEMAVKSMDAALRSYFVFSN